MFKKNQSFNRMSNVRKITWNELTKRNGIGLPKEIIEIVTHDILLKPIKIGAKM